MKRIFTLAAGLMFTVFFANSQSFEGKMELVNLGRKVNTGYHEAGPLVTPDGRTIYFFVHNHPENTYGKEGSQDVWFSVKNEDGEWGPAQHMDRPFNNHRSNQVFGVMGDGNVLFIRGGSKKNSKGFSFVTKTGQGWSDPSEVKIDGFREMNRGKYYGATISSDGSIIILYFSEREHSHFSDIYISRKKDDGSYARPKKIEGLNTGRDEFAPFLAPDDKTLYFSSSRKDLGEGSADIYVSRRKSTDWSDWTEPENLGRPVNTRAFDAYLSVDADGKIYVTQSGRTIDGGNLDIFTLEQRAFDIELKGIVADAETQHPIRAELQFVSDKQTADTVYSGDNGYTLAVNPKTTYDVHVVADGYQAADTTLAIGKIENDSILFQDFRLVPNKRAVMLSGIVYDADSGEPVNGSITLHTPAGNNRDIVIRTNSEGYYEKELTLEGWFMITGAAEGYMNARDSVYNTTEEYLLTRDLYLDPVEIGTTVVLNNIFFDFDKTTLKPASYSELNTVLNFLETNPTIRIEIAGHTDDRGSHEYNASLSQGRAQAVVDYLINQGIDEMRLVAKGYGESAPIASNGSDAGRATNRRVEFTVLSINDLLQP